MIRSRFRNLKIIATLLSIVSVIPSGFAADGSEAANPGTGSRTATTETKESNTALTSDELLQLKAQIAVQQQQIEQLIKTLAAQQKLLERNTGGTSAPAPVAPASQPDQSAASALSQPSQKGLGEVASTTPVIPLGPAAPAKPAFQHPPESADQPGPLQFKLGNAFISPVGFMDMTEVSRSTNPGTGIGTNFGSIPYGNTQLGSLTESRLSIQNSRVGMRIDTGFKDIGVMGYWESDFLGQLGNPPNGGLAVTSNPYVMRLRLYWVDVRKGGWEILGGQSWSLMTPNRRGVSPLPGDIFYSQDIDVNYQLGLVWGRIPGFRGAYHFNDKAVFAVALENSEPYIGGGNGGSAATLPAALAAAANFSGTQVNAGNSVISSAALFPDVIAKLAFDPSPKFHFEIAGVEIANKIANPASTPAFQTHTKAGGGGSINLNFELFKGFRLLTNNYWSSGGGRYIFGQAPDFMIRANGGISLVHSGSTVTGFEATAGKTLYYGYYGAVYVGKDTALDANGKTLIGYGPLSSDGQNRAIQEITFGTNTTLAKDAKWGALNLMLQYSYLQRNPWLVTGTAPSNAHLSMGFLNLRYTLPGSANPRTGFLQH